MSYSQYLKGKAIQTGCEWRLKIKVVSTALAAFPSTAKFTAQVRVDADSPVLATLTTQAGNIIRVDDTSIEIVLPGSISAEWSSGKVVMDVVRTDLTDKIHLGFDLEIPVKRSVTRL
ncbi:hypothetical protein IB265_33370 [Ensifer sp. ENS10]|uniref:hypothetical protein n=1 Tax=Ensifer sp. ENS10 TaxID=2769286 RepID=UPI0017829D33|nr:hypothetical protein [Ensifer sp. ENS10]MBD9511648.1 hypothetical protein [Ensifer sp. ENS10]